MMLVKSWFSSLPHPSHSSVSPGHSTVSGRHTLSLFYLSYQRGITNFPHHGGGAEITVPSYFGAQVVLDVVSGSSFNLAPVPFWPNPITLWGHFLPFWYNLVFQVHLEPTLHLSYVCPVISHFSSESWFCSEGKGQDLGVRCGHCSWSDFDFWPFQWTKLRNKHGHVYIHTDINTYIHMCAYEHAYTYCRNHEFTPHLQFPSIPIAFFLAFPHFVFVCPDNIGSQAKEHIHLFAQF